MRVALPLAATALLLLGLPAAAQADVARPGPAAASTASAVKPAAVASNPIGRLEVARQAGGLVTIGGWSFDNNGLNSPERVDVLETAPMRKLVASTTTTILRADVNRAFKITGNHGYSASFHGDGGTDTFCAYGINIGVGSNVQLGCAKVIIPTSAPVGHLDTATAAGLSVNLAGWSYDPDVPSSAEQIQLYQTAPTRVLLKTISTTLTRADINSHFKITGTHGWQSTLTGVAGTRTYCAYAVNLGPVRANPSIGCKTLTLSAPVVNAWIYGNVVDSAFQPIVGAKVNATTVSGTVVKTVLTDSKGAFRLDLPLGTYHVCVIGNSGTGPDVLGYLDECLSFNGQYGPPSDLTLTAAQGYGNYYIDMISAAEIAGRVTDSAGTPLAGVTVGGDAGDPGTTTTASDGTYLLRREAGYATVCFDGRTVNGGVSAAGYLRACWGPDYYGTPVEADPGQKVTGIDIQLAAAAKLTGHVTDAAGHALTGARVIFGGGDTTTDAGGNFSFLGWQAGYESNISVSATTGMTGGSSTTGYLSWCPGDPYGLSCGAITLTAGQVFVMNAVLSSAGAVAGKVVDSDGRPIPNAGVQVDGYGTAYTAADGTYRINGLISGSHTVCFQAPYQVPAGSDGYLDQCWQNSGPPTAPTPIMITLGMASTGIDATLKSRGHISGRITDATGKPLPDASIDGYFTGSGYTGGVTGGSIAADGTYLLPKLIPGVYHLCFEDYNSPYAQACYSPDITVPVGGVVTGIDIVLPLAATISGTITDDQGQPVPGVQVQLGGGTAANETVYTQADGSYTLTGVDPGDHTVCFDPFSIWNQPPTGYTSQCWHGVEPGDPPTEFDVTAGQTVTGIDAVIHVGAGISGRVTDTAGNPLQGVQVSSSDLQYTSTDADGNYLLTQVTPGQQTVCFSTYSATGGISTTGYQGTCYGAADDGTPAPITVVPHQTTTGINQQLQANPATD